MNNIIFYDLELRNFLSYGNNTTKINLNFNKPSLIIGKNYDSVVDGNIESNGAGKSSIINALCYCLYDETLSKIESKNNLINIYNEKNMVVSLTFSVGNTYYKISRYRKCKSRGGNGVSILKFKDSSLAEYEDITPDSIINSNKFIEDVLGITFNSFSRIVVFSASYQPFLSLPRSSTSGANQRDILEEVFGLTILSKKADVLKENIKNKKIEMEKNIVLLNEILRQKKITENELVEYNSKLIEWENKKNYSIEKIEKEKTIISKIDFKKQKDILNELATFNQLKNNISQNIKNIKSEIDNFNNILSSKNSWELNKNSKIKQLSTKLEELKQIDFELIENNLEKIKKLNEEYKEIEKNTTINFNNCKKKDSELNKMEQDLILLKDSKCPYCKQHYNSEDSIKNVEDNIIELKSEIKEINETMFNSIIQLDKIKNELSILKEKTNNYNSIQDLIKDRELFLQLGNELKMKESEMNPYLEMYNKLNIDSVDKLNEKLIKMNDEFNENNKNIELLKQKLEFNSLEEIHNTESSLSVIQEKINSLTESVNPYTEIVLNLKNKKFNTELSEINAKDTDDLNHMNFLFSLLTKKDSFIRKGLIKSRLSLLNEKMSEYISELNLPHRLMFREDMSINITNFGKEISINNLSSGQQARINLALAFAFRHILQLNTKKINFCLLDETLDIGLSTVGVQLAIGMIKNIAANNKMSMFLITHKDEVSTLFDSKLEIELRNGFSSVVQSDTGFEEIVEAD